MRTPSGLLFDFLRRERQLHIEFCEVDVVTGKNYSEEFLAVTPRGKTPVVFDGDLRLTENATILRYICQKYDEPGYPHELLARIRVDERLDFIGTQFLYYFINVFLVAQFGPHYKFGVVREAIPEEMITFARDRSRLYMNVIDGQWLGGTNRYLTGDEVTIADYLLVAMAVVIDQAGLSTAMFPHYTAWKARMLPIPNLQASWNAMRDRMGGTWPIPGMPELVGF